MRSSGHDWFGRAQAAVIAHLDRRGTPQRILVERLGLSKQAVQQLVDDLTERGVVERLADPQDRRARIIRFTARGKAVLADADRIKTRIERRYARRLGQADLKELARLLARLTDQPG